MRGQPKLIQRKDSPYWFIYIPPTHGKRATRFSTGETDYRQAEKVFAQWTLEGQKPELTDAEQLRIIDILLRYAQHKKADLTVGYNMKHLEPFFEGMMLSNICNAVIRDYCSHRLSAFAIRGTQNSKRKVSPATVRRELNTLSAALGYARREGYIKEVPFIEKPSDSPPRDRWLTHEEVGALLNAAENNKPLKLFIEVALSTGARPSSILELTWFQIDLKSRLIHFNPEGRKQTHKIRPTVYIDNRLFTVLSGLKKKEGHLFGGIKSLKHGFRLACKRANLKGVTPYTLRHTAITWTIRDGHSLALAGQLAGHRDSRTTMRYAKHDPLFTKALTSTLSTGVELAYKMAKKGKKAKNGSNKR